MPRVQQADAFVSYVHKHGLFVYLPPGRDSDPESSSMLTYPVPYTVRAFVFIAKILQPSLPSLPRGELSSDGRQLNAPLSESGMYCKR